METKQLPSGWKEVKLIEVFEIKKGKSITRDLVTTGNVPVIAGGQSPAYYHNKSNRKGETITVSGSGAYAGFVNYFNQPIFASDCSTLQAINNKQLSVKYGFYFLKSNQNRIYALQKGIAQPHVYPKDLISIKIPLPPISSQKKIVKTLEQAEKLKNFKKQSKELTKEYLKSVFNEMFYNQGFQEVKLGDLSEINPKKSEIKKTDNDLEVSFVPMEDIQEQNIYFEQKKIKLLSEVYKGYTYFKEGDILLAKVTPCFENGKAGVAKNLKNKIGFGSSEYHVIRSSEKLLPELIYFFISSKRFINAGKKQMTGTSGLKRLSKSYLENFHIPLPPLPLQKKFASIVEKVEKIKEHQKQSEEEINNLFNALMQKAFRGKL